jgi:branched-chain amino acid transport system ATP-binding protein
MAEPLLVLDHLRKAYDALVVTDDVNLALFPGELHAVIGPNGAGKTTLVHQISGLAAPDAGRILFRGEDVTRHAMHERVKRGLARSFQITSILPGFSALENVALAVQARSGSSFRFFGDAAAEDELNEPALGFLDDVGLGPRAHLPAGLLSHGEKRQLELAVALATGPKLLLLDEPLAGTGHEESERVVAMLRRLKGRYAIMLIEHDMDAVFALADRVSVLVYGRVIATGAPEEVRANAEVRGAYLGEEAQNPLPACGERPTREASG